MTDFRTWFITSTTYGTWLPGDDSGFVGRVRDYRLGDGAPVRRVEHDTRGEQYDAGIAGLLCSARNLMKGGKVLLTAEQALAVRDQFLETATHRRWHVLALAVMANHFHIVVVTGPNYGPDEVLGDFKSYASRALNRRWARPASGRWWTTSGSHRELTDAPVVEQKVRYTLDQEFPLALYAAEGVRESLSSERGV